MAGATQHSPWLPGCRPSATARLRLFGFPHGGAGPGIFQGWADSLPDGVEMAGVLLPGRERRLREPAFHRMEPLVEALTSALQPFLDRPFAFFGHSMGALVCFEVAHRLRSLGSPEPLALFVSGRRAPNSRSDSPPTYNLPDAEFKQEIRRLGGTPPEVLQHDELLQIFLPILRADFAVCDTYTYVSRPPLRCPIRAFGGWQDRIAPRDDLARWREQTDSDFRLHMFPGGHFFLQTSAVTFLETLAREIELLLASRP